MYERCFALITTGIRSNMHQAPITVYKRRFSPQRLGEGVGRRVADVNDVPVDNRLRLFAPWPNLDMYPLCNRFDGVRSYSVLALLWFLVGFPGSLDHQLGMRRKSRGCHSIVG